MPKEVEVLRELIRDKRAEPTPEVDWKRVEQQLMQKVESDAPAPLPRAPSWHAAVFVAAAAAVALAGIGVLSHYHSTPETQAPVGKVAKVLRAPTQHRLFGPAATEVSGSRLAIGDRVVTGTHAIRVEHAGRAVWTLAPNSRATLALSGRYLTVRLDSGSITADVVPSPRPESFAVEVGQTRVAVHGTHFTVTRVGDQAKVTLERGVVAVGPSSARGHTEGFLMQAPATGTFSLDGAKQGHVEPGLPAAAQTTAAGEPTPPSRAVPKASGITPPAQPATTTEPPSVPLPDQPARSDLARGADQVTATVRSCFEKHTASESGTRVSAHSTLSIRVKPDGSITELNFNPPLAPSVQGCSAAVLQSVHFPASRRGATVTRSLKLER